jgi:hypothetical protein
MGKTWRGLITDLVVNLLSFSMDTQTHDFGNHNNSYDRSKIALVRSVSGLPEF